MKKVFNSLSELVGNTPLIRLKKIEKSEGITGELIIKAEWFNPYSVKDRPAKKMIQDAEEKGLLKNRIVVEPTSGNTGIGLAFVCAEKGYRLILTMPETMSEERKKLLKLLNAELILTSGKLGMTGAIEKAKEIAEKENAFMPMQFENESNVMSHKVTAQEILDCYGAPSYFVAGVGTGGTISGVGGVLKEKGTKIIAVEPCESPVLSGGAAGAHRIQGIGAGFIPKNYNKDVVSEVKQVSGDDSYAFVKKIAAEEGILLGVSGAATVLAAVRLLKENPGKSAIVLCADSGERYLSIL